MCAAFDESSSGVALQLLAQLLSAAALAAALAASLAEELAACVAAAALMEAPGTGGEWAV